MYVYVRLCYVCIAGCCVSNECRRSVCMCWTGIDVCMYTSIYVMCALQAAVSVMNAAEVSDMLDRN
jgi:hypothetical protein